MRKIIANGIILRQIGEFDMYKIITNKIRCKKCGDVLESKSVHDFKWCSCRAVAVDGGKEYLKRCAKDLDDIEDLSEVEQGEPECMDCIYSNWMGKCEKPDHDCDNIKDKKDCFIER